MLRSLQNAGVIAIAVLFVVGFCAGVWHASNTPHAPINQSTAAQKNHPADAQTIEERHQATEETIAYYNKWLMFFTAILAVATVGLGFATVGLYRVNQSQFRHAVIETQRARVNRLRDDERLREQMDIARQNADAASQQARAAEAALTQLERPYVFIFGVRGIKQDAESGEFYVEYAVANYGKMPAIIESPNVGFEISDRVEPPMPPRIHDGHQLVASPILQAGEQRKKIRAYFPAGMVGPDINVVIETIRAADVEPNQILYGDGTEEEPRTVFPTFNTPEGFDVFFRAVIQYRGPFTSGHETAALWLLNPSAFEFAVRGGEEYNYVK
jgi:hypothetical protein